MALIQKRVVERCPLCSARIDRNVLEHLQHDHGRTEGEARALVVRSVEGTLGWDPETKKKKASLKYLSSA
jgi:hypothetical protein